MAYEKLTAQVPSFTKYDDHDEAFVSSRDAADFIGFQRGNLRTFVDGCLRRSELNPRNIRMASYVIRDMVVPMHYLSTSALRRVSSMNPSISTGDRAERASNLIAAMTAYQNEAATKSVQTIDLPSQEVEVEVTPAPAPSKADTLSIPIRKLGLQPRAYNALRAHKLFYLGDLVQKTERSILRYPGCAHGTVTAIKDALAKYDLSLGTSVNDWDRPALGRPKLNRKATIKAAAPKVDPVQVRGGLSEPTDPGLVHASERNLVVSDNGTTVRADSRDVARTFDETAHWNMCRRIRELMTNAEVVQRKMFVEATAILPHNRQKQTYFMMNRDGFTLVVMGFVGAKALAWKLQYIDAFNRMEAQLRKQGPADASLEEMIQNPDRMLVVLQGLIGQRIKDRDTIVDLTRKSEQLDHIEARVSVLQGARTITAVASSLGVKRSSLVDHLLGASLVMPLKYPWIKRDHEHRNELCPASYGVHAGFVTSKKTQFYNRRNGQMEIAQTPLITPSGEAYLSKTMKPDHPGFLKMQNAASKAQAQKALSL